ncbi:hypothetical protein [Sinomicrobium weinanense]|uniref:Uncharacterized protein n=1 Tax=Sinomicrobium weinanense TaxID=2842200 RepID=A0A926JNG8_9FLAO|nr:hypothetical protein [Sinomicrobium weinanense]MBC9794537.1 hypothetical protein [Sinomicrobium weinanense]MBU3124444.1 hypothetical protein [Sinomicrobium weinanense]
MPFYTTLLRPVAVILTTIVFISCSSDDDTVPEPEYTPDELYHLSVTDAMVADTSEIIDTLWAISPENPGLQWKKINGRDYVLMASFNKYPSSYPAGDSITNTWGESWLFIPSQMKARLKTDLTQASDTIMRICQVLGLPPANENSNTHISTLWVNPESLYRPAGDPDIHTTSAGAALRDNVTATYVSWFNNYIIFAYYRTLGSENDRHYPWTRLGYTYDWSPETEEVGLSEFVLSANSGFWVESTDTAGDFFRK